MHNPFNHQKYRPFAFAPKMLNRQWPEQTIDHAPSWCSVDLRDGNQALIEPLTVEQKLQFFDVLIACGFKEIEIGFPSASQPEFDFTRRLVDENRIPDDVTVQVLVQAREHLIERTFESLVGVKRAVVHVYNSTSKVQRDKVFAKSLPEIKQIAIEGATLLKDYAAKHPNSEWIFQYSPESFSQTETDYAVEVSEAVCRVWQPENGQKVILNLPSTVEASTPNLFADQVEYFCQNLPSRKEVIICVHTHNDRGCAVACGELAVMAGADRVEGTLLGNGERTGNMDIITMAMNLYSQGIDPKLDFSNMNHIAQTVSDLNNLPIHPRHPYVGDLVFTAFSGSHQDAIKKSLEHDQKDAENGAGFWDIAYLPIDPKDIGRTYQDVVRINSQSGKGGVAYVLQRDYGIELPRWLQIDFAQVVQRYSEQMEKELSSADIHGLLIKTYMQHDVPVQLKAFSFARIDDKDRFNATLQINQQALQIEHEASGTLSAFVGALEKALNKSIRVLSYGEHALSAGTRAEAMAYVKLDCDGQQVTGIAKHNDTVSAMLQATLCGVNQAQKLVS